MLISFVISPLVYGCAAYLGIELAQWLVVRGGATFQGNPQTMTLVRLLLVAVTAVVGALLASYLVGPIVFGTTGLVCVALCMAIWCELGYGTVPDLIVLVPLATLIIVAIVSRQWGLLIGGAFLTAPFAVLGLMSRGKNVARSDGELAALGGVMLGPAVGLAAFGLAVLAAFLVNIRTREARVQLTPYFAAGIVAGILLQLFKPTH